MTITRRSFLLLLSISLLVSFVFAEIRFTEIGYDDSVIIPFDEFGFTQTGRLELNLSQVILSNKNLDLDLAKLGFFLCTSDAWKRAFQQLIDGEITCPLESDHIKFVADFKFLNGKSSFDTVIRVNEPDRYRLVFTNCLWRVKVSMNVRSSMYNLEGKQNRRDYLSTGETILPTVYFLSSLAYFTLAGISIYVLKFLYKRRLTSSPIHSYMLVFVILKAYNLVWEAQNKHTIKQTGSSPDNDMLFYILISIKGMMVYILTALILAGWSYLKPYLEDKEKRVLMTVIPLQVVAHLAIVFIGDTPLFVLFKVTWSWKTAASLVQLICYCTVLLRLYLSVRKLRQAAPADVKAVVKLMKLTVCSRFYVAVICYIYLPHAVVYALETNTCYEYQWAGVVVGELATVVFYVFTWYNFKPEPHNPYSVADDEEKPNVAAVQLVVEDEKRIGQSLKKRDS